MPADQAKPGWTFRSIAIATGLAFAGMMITMQLMEWQLWPEDDWTFLLVPAVLSSVFLAVRHRGTAILTAVVFFPLLVFVMFYAAACLPLASTH